MMKKNQLIILALMLLFGCSNLVEQTSKKIDESVDSFLLPETSLVNSTIDFVMYANPKNYWFTSSDRDETPSVVDKLENLIIITKDFEYSDYEMMEASINLIDATTEIRNNLIDAYNNSDINDYLAYLLFGDYGLITSNIVDDIPKKLSNSIAKMDSIARMRYYIDLPEKIFQLELFAIGDKKISIDQYKEIRSYTINSTKESLIENISCKEKEWKLELIDIIMDQFKNLFPINDSYNHIIDNQKHSGMLYKFMASTNVNYCDYKNMLPGDCNWGYIFIDNNKNVISRFECLDADFIEYKIGKLNNKKGKKICELNKSFVFPAPDIFDENSLSIDELMKQGIMSKIEKKSIELLPSDCSQYTSIIKMSYELENGNEEIQTFVVKTASLKEYYEFRDDIRKIGEIL